MEGKVKI